MRLTWLPYMACLHDELIEIDSEPNTYLESLELEEDAECKQCLCEQSSRGEECEVS